MAIFHIQSICVEDEDNKDTETATWIRTHFPILVSIASNSIRKPIFLCDPNRHDLISTFFVVRDNLATQSRT